MSKRVVIDETEEGTMPDKISKGSASARNYNRKETNRKSEKRSLNLESNYKAQEKPSLSSFFSAPVKPKINSIYNEILSDTESESNFDFEASLAEAMNQISSVSDFDW
jgi:hypothetical protein